MIESIDVGNTRYCYLIRAIDMPSTTTFFTPSDAELQVGFVVHGRGSEIPRHAHRPTERSLSVTGEVLFVQRGRCEIDLYSEQGELVAVRELRTGDVVILLGGGHGFRMLEDTVLLEVKQGPYAGVGEKVHF